MNTLNFFKEQQKLRLPIVRDIDRLMKLKQEYDLPVDIRLKSLGKRNGLKIFLVDGFKVRHFIDLDFTMGGHGLRYFYIPVDEIWIDSSNVKEKEEVITHEITEFKLMEKGMSYDRAHEFGSLAELEVMDRKIILPVGHFFQTKDWSCGPSALKIVLNYYDDKKNINELIKTTECDKEGTLHSGFRKALKKYGYKFLEKPNSKIEDIEKFIQRGIPVIVDYQDYHFSHGGHFSVVIGYDSKKLLFSNPAIKRKFEWISKKQFEKRWWEEDEPGKIVKRWLLAIYR